MAGIYIHIPFCRKACHYCDFHFSTNRDRVGEMTAAICRELFLRKDYVSNESINTIYFGGGTPSLLGIWDLDMIFRTLRENFNVAADAEITLEANPDDLSEEKLLELKSLSINRLSIGIQSFDDPLLSYLNRSHDAATSIDSFHRARHAGFKNISVDLIYGIPGLSDGAWQKNIETVLSLGPEHVSSYSLTIEPGTVFGNWLERQKLPPVNDDGAASQLHMLVELLGEAGYDQYEVSNFGKPGFYSRHNSSYWTQEVYLGVGPGAHSFDRQSRQANIRNNNVYIKELNKNNVPSDREILTRQDKVNDYLLTTLRTSWGADLIYLRRQFDFNILDNNKSYVQKLLDQGLAVISRDHLRLTSRGKFFADKISSDLFLSEE